MQALARKKIRELADCSVADAELASPNRRTRLNETALDAKMALDHPPFNVGKPIEAARQIAVTFTSTRFFHRWKSGDTILNRQVITLRASVRERK
jgi:hypothetical protein